MIPILGLCRTGRFRSQQPGQIDVLIFALLLATPQDMKGFLESFKSAISCTDSYIFRHADWPDSTKMLHIWTVSGEEVVTQKDGLSDVRTVKQQLQSKMALTQNTKPVEKANP